MHRTVLALLLGLSQQMATAQPGWSDIKVAFAYYYEGVRMSPQELRQDPTFQMVVAGETQRVGSYGLDASHDLCHVAFEGHYFGPMLHADTLRMGIGHHGQWMYIVLPPRGLEGQSPYTTIGLRIDFKPGRALITGFPKEVLVQGIVKNLESVAAGKAHFDLLMRCGDKWSIGPIFDRSTGRIDGILTCTTVMDGRDEWLNFTLATRNWYGEMNSNMHIRTRYWPNIDLGKFDLIGSYYFFDGRELRIDKAVPRDTIIAGQYEGDALVMVPINPSPSDTLRIHVQWSGSGATHVTGHTMKKRRGVTGIRFTFGVRTDEVVATDSWTERATIMEVPVSTGPYILTQLPGKKENVRDVDLLIGRSVPFVVEDR